MRKKLIRNVEITDPTTLEDLVYIMANNIEHSFLEAGAEPGKDYTMLDCFKLGMPFALEAYKKCENSTFAAGWNYD